MTTQPCPNHPESPIAKQCGACRRSFCAACVLPTQAGARCRDCIDAAVGPGAPAKGSSPVVWIVAGVVLVGSLFLCVPLIAAIAIPNLLGARKHANEACAIGALKTLSTAEVIFKEGDKDGNGKLDYGTLSQLGQVQLVDSVLASGRKQGYTFQCQPGNDPEKVFWAMASPQVPRSSGDRVFYTNQTGAVYYAVATPGSTPALPDPETGAPPPGAVPTGR